MSQHQANAYRKLLRHAIGLCQAIFELITGNEAPRWQELLK